MTDLLQRAGDIATDRESGASELTARLIALLDDALSSDASQVVPIARLVTMGQPAMAPVWHACAAALLEQERPGSFARMRQASERAPSALARVGSTALVEQFSEIARPLILTVSSSRSVRDVLGAVQAIKPLQVVCGEGRPRYEGRRLAEWLGQQGVDVTLTTDAAVSAFVPQASAVLVGADSVAATFWINKVGTRALAAAAHLSNVPVFVTVTTDKALPSQLASRWRPTGAAPSEVWSDPPSSVRVENPYFEAVPADLATAFLTEIGRLESAHLPALSERGAEQVTSLLEALARL